MAYEDDIKWASNYISTYNPNETVNYNDGRLLDVERQRASEQKNINQTYNDMISNSDNFYNNLINTQKDYMNQQTNIQNANTEQAIKEINQQKDKTERDYQKEQRGAYQDYRNQINNYGVNAEIRASQGLNNTGYAESSNTSMYNTWQNRVSTARQALQDSMLQYDNMITQARLSNNEKLAEIAFKFAQAQAQYALEGFQYKNTLVESKQTRLAELGARYDTKYQNMLNQINNELSARRDLFSQANSTVANYNKLKQDQDQFEKQLAYQKEQDAKKMAYQREQDEKEMAYKRERDAVADAQWQKQYNLSIANSKKATGGSSSRTTTTTVQNTQNSQQQQQSSISDLIKKVGSTVTLFLGSNTSKSKAIDNAVQKGKINSDEANRLFEYYNL